MNPVEIALRDMNIGRPSRPPKRSCATEGKGRCSLCCKVLPVLELDKPQGKWCQHAGKGTGCRIYQDPARPDACSTWRCMWVGLDENERLPGTLFAALRRPDQVHYVIEHGADVFYVDGKGIGCMVIYPDLNYPDAWRRDKVLIEMIKAFAQSRVATMVRYPDYGLAILAPPLVPEWKEEKAPYTRPASTVEEKRAVIGDKGWEKLEPLVQLDEGEQP